MTAAAATTFEIRSPDRVLAAVTERQQVIARAEADLFVLAVEWAALHPGDQVETTTPYEERDLEVAGDGAPTVAEYALVEFAAATGRSTTSGGLYLGDAVEVRHRLPRLWERVLAGQVAVWRARRVAQLTKSLPAEAAAYVDRHLTPVMGRCSWAQIDRTVEAARARFDPAETTRRAREAAEARGVDIRLGEAAITATATGTGTGTVGMEARLDLADALDLEDAVAQVAQDLLQTHPDLSLNARRAMALGIIARGEAGGSRRQVTIYTHHQAQGPDDPLVEVENTRSVVVPEQVATWCATPGTKVIIKPVIDLAENLTTDTYRPTPAQYEQARLLHPTCVFVGCTRPSRACDLDHLTPWPLGPTETWNLAPLCRRHHRAKTTGGWTHRRLTQTTFEWTSPHGRTYRVTSDRHTH
jgi:hypothetical protein